MHRTWLAVPQSMITFENWISDWLHILALAETENYDMCITALRTGKSFGQRCQPDSSISSPCKYNMSDQLSVLMRHRGNSHLRGHVVHCLRSALSLEQRVVGDCTSECGVS